MSALADKIRRTRESKVTVGDHVFIIRRPTELQWAEEAETLDARALLKYVVGWEGITEMDMMPGGAAHPVEFSEQAAYEWLSDRLDILMPLATAIVENFARHLEAKDKRLKN